MLFTAVGSLLSTGHLDSSQHVTDLLVTMENAIMLIGPQLTQSPTLLETTENGKRAQSHSIVLTDLDMFAGTLTFSDMLHNQVEAEIAVQWGKATPTGLVHLHAGNATVVTDWETAAGTGAYPGKRLIPHPVCKCAVHQTFKSLFPFDRFCSGCIVELHKPQHFI